MRAIPRLSFLSTVFLIASAFIFFGGCAVEESDFIDASSSVGAETEPFARSPFVGYKMFSIPTYDLYRLRDMPHPVDIMFSEVGARNGENVIFRLPRFLVSGITLLTVTVDGTIESEFLLSGTPVANVEATCVSPANNACLALATAEVIFQTSAGADAFNAALSAARFPPNP